MAEVVVYTALYGSYDDLKPPLVGGRHVVFTDQPIEAEGWEVWRTSEFLTGRRAARAYKCQGPVILRCPTIWHDANSRLKVEPEQLLEEWLGDEYDAALFAHPVRDCLYMEAQVVKSKHKDTPAVVDAQMARYRKAGFPEHFGLGETTLLVRAYNEAVLRLGQWWWAEIEQGSIRDQLSFDYIRWQMGTGRGLMGATYPLRVNHVDGGQAWKKRRHPVLECWRHKGQ